jgi:hypothetical protein
MLTAATGIQEDLSFDVWMNPVRGIWSESFLLEPQNVGQGALLFTLL